jgi:hypothetical protein
MVRGPTNEERARCAGEALCAYLSAKGERSDEANFSDLLSDLMHWCRINSKDFDEALGIARRHFQAEKHD